MGVLSDAEQPFGVKSFPSDNSKLAEMEFYLVADLECDLTVFHPYRTLMALCKKESANESTTEAGEVGAEVDDGSRYWGTGEGQLELSDDALQLAWYGHVWCESAESAQSNLQVHHQRYLQIRSVPSISSTPPCNHSPLSYPRSTRAYKGHRLTKIITKPQRRPR